MVCYKQGYQYVLYLCENGLWEHDVLVGKKDCIFVLPSLARCVLPVQPLSTLVNSKLTRSLELVDKV